MMQNIFKKIKNKFSDKFNLNNQNYSQNNNLEKVSEKVNEKVSEKVNEKSNNKFKILKIGGNKFDINSLDKESKIIVELYEISNIKIKFFKNLLKQLKVNRNLKIIELKSKLKKENLLE